MGVSRVTCYAVARAPTPPTPFAARLANLVRSWVPCTLPCTLPCTPLMSADRPAPSAAPPPTARTAAAFSSSTAQSAAARATAARPSPAVPGPTEALHAATVTQPVAAEHWLHSHRPLSSWQRRKQRRRTCRQSRCRRPLEHGRLTRHLLRRRCASTDATYAVRCAASQPGPVVGALHVALHAALHTPLMSADRPAPSAAPPPTARTAAAFSSSTALSAAARATAARTSPAVPGPTEALHAATVTQPVAAEHWLHSHRPLSSWQRRKQRRRTCRQSRCRRPLEHGRLTRHLLRRCASTDATYTVRCAASQPGPVVGALHVALHAALYAADER